MVSAVSISLRMAEKDLFKKYGIEAKGMLDMFFKPVKDNENVYTCICCPGPVPKLLKQKKGTGYSNLKNHAFNFHNDEIEEMILKYLGSNNSSKCTSSDSNNLDSCSGVGSRQSTKKARKITSFFSNATCKKENDLYDLMELIIMVDMRFAMVESKRLRRLTSLPVAGISTKIFTKYVLRTRDLVTEKIKNMLPSTFGIIFDG